jgi:tRNA(adenine34) deaminase
MADRATDEYWIRRALQVSARARDAGDVPVGAVLVADGQCVAEGWNQCMAMHDPSAHAEIVAMRAAGLIRHNYRLLDTTLYVTLEPCLMCVGAMVHARIARLVYGAFDAKTGAVGGAFSLLDAPQHNHRIAVTEGVLAAECGEALKDFFKVLRMT